MASDEPIDGNIQHMAPLEHNTGTVPGAAVVDADGAVVADASGAAVVNADGTAVADEDAMPIVVIDYRRPVPFVFEACRRGPTTLLR